MTTASPPDPDPPEPAPDPTTPTRAQRLGRVLHTVFTWPGWTTLTASITAIAAVTALYFTGQTLRATNNQNISTRESAITERFAKASEQLSSDKLNSRVAGVYLLGRLAHDSPDDQTSVMEVLTAFVRTNSPVEKCAGRPPKIGNLQADIQAVVTVFSRLPHSQSNAPDLSSTCLAGATLKEGDLSWADFTFSDLTDIVFEKVDLSQAQMMDANLTRALFSSTMTGTRFNGSNLSHANFAASRLDGATFNGANLAGTKFWQARNLEAADFLPPDPEGVKVYCNNDTEWPPGFTAPTCRPTP